MPTWTAITTLAKDDAVGYQRFNNLKNNLDYLKQQSEIVVAQDATRPNEKVAYGEYQAARLVKAPVLLSLVSQTLYTVATNYTGVLDNLIICNSDSVGQLIGIYLVPAAGSPTVDNQIWADFISGNRTIGLGLQTVLPAGTMLQAIALTTPSTVAVHVTPIETQVAFLKSSPPALLSNTLPGSPQYTFTAQGSILEIILCNTGALRRLVTVHAIPPAGTAGVDTLIFQDYISARRTIFIQSQKTLASGGTIKAFADAASLVGMRLSIVEP